MISFEIDLFSIDDFAALILTRANNVQSLAFLFLPDDRIGRGEIFNSHCIYQNADIILGKTLEKDWFFYQFPDRVGRRLVFLDHSGDEVFLFLVKLPVNFRADSLPTNSILFFILFQFSQEPFVSFLLLLLVWAVFWVRGGIDLLPFF